jgi:hypothetical protein
VVIFLFGLEALFTRGSKAQLCAVCSLPQSKQLRKTLKSAKMIYICILYLKSLETYLETLHSHFQPNCYFKMLKNSGSVYYSIFSTCGPWENSVCQPVVIHILLHSLIKCLWLWVPKYGGKGDNRRLERFPCLRRPCFST